jgi:CRISPR/Cas system-associated exonuclease Cas4 (RecB family)
MNIPTGKRLRYSKDGLARLSRSKVDAFLNCPRCFWLDVKAGVKAPSGPPFNLNIAVDHLFKNEFDVHRAAQTVPPRLAAVGLALVPVAHPQMDAWRHNFTGVTRARAVLGLELFGAIDDLWHDGHGMHFVADYKATSKKEPVSLDAEWQIAYKRQAEFYQWLLRGNGLQISDRAYFVYSNGIKDGRPFDDVLRFETRILPYDGNASWVEPTLLRLRECLEQTVPPAGANSCETCAYLEAMKPWD